MRPGTRSLIAGAVLVRPGTRSLIAGAVLDDRGAHGPFFERALSSTPVVLTEF